MFKKNWQLSGLDGSDLWIRVRVSNEWMSKVKNQNMSAVCGQHICYEPVHGFFFCGFCTFWAPLASDRNATAKDPGNSSNVMPWCFNRSDSKLAAFAGSFFCSTMTPDCTAIRILDLVLQSSTSTWIDFPNRESIESQDWRALKKLLTASPRPFCEQILVRSSSSGASPICLSVMSGNMPFNDEIASMSTFLAVCSSGGKEASSFWSLSIFRASFRVLIMGALQSVPRKTSSCLTVSCHPSYTSRDFSADHPAHSWATFFMSTSPKALVCFSSTHSLNALKRSSKAACMKWMILLNEPDPGKLDDDDRSRSFMSKLCWPKLFLQMSLHGSYPLNSTSAVDSWVLRESEGVDL